MEKLESSSEVYIGSLAFAILPWWSRLLFIGEPTMGIYTVVTQAQICRGSHSRLKSIYFRMKENPWGQEQWESCMRNLLV